MPCSVVKVASWCTNSDGQRTEDPRTEPNRACHPGISHKYCSKADLDSALSCHKTKASNLKRALTANEKLLEDSWQNNQSACPFVEKLLYLINTNTLSDFDISFLSNWLGKKVGGRWFHADEQARNLTVLLSNRLGEKMYSTIAPMMGLPAARQAQRLNAKDCSSFTYMPGLNDWAFDAASKTHRPYMDSTRVIRAVELYRNNYLIG